MYQGKMVFSQIMEFLPMYEFHKCVKRYNGNYRTRSFSCLDQFLSMAFAQLTYRESLRDIEACLRAMDNKLYHMGIRGNISRSTLANANEQRDWHIYANFAQILIKQARELYKNESLSAELTNSVYALDATIIELCFSLFPWAYQCNKHSERSTFKLQTLLDLRGNIPTFIQLTQPGGSDAPVLDHIIPEPGSFYIMDKGYLDTARLYSFHKALAFFVIRAKKGMLFQRILSQPVDKTNNLKCDQIIKLTGRRGSSNYPERLRRICLIAQDHKHLTFLTNNFSLPAITIAQLYKSRWQVELFFKWIKQNLRIKRFYGNSKNAVLTQIWIAISVYVLIAIIKKRLQIDHSLYTFLQFLSVTIFEKTPILQALTTDQHLNENARFHNQLILFN